ncbi:hypothetical protein DUNSADRAFT_15139 [Dunaliella salina]|uniref:Sodium/calcium exchanger membrane region domain-containing protein n=1 Tax=Dunaliella salina TaxID=3046 RepID=A0ABQ7H267_DUNSA|nr:hypothetical protein DUNSADRAFT_15139 [Dunaliella salina]|eukprot:KAF5840938.1 hypothetical protein DUNSADRAFT_15139 [Dunaliella salina]
MVACSNPPIAGAIMLGWLLLLFCTMYVASDAFFCPTLELISDHLNLSPAVAGATLLAFGNGAPDLMSIIASMHSGAKGGGPVAPASVSMALSEPLGTGLFVGNIVLGATVLVSRASREVAICPFHFFKDITFYLTALGTILYCLIVGEVRWSGATSLFICKDACSCLGAMNAHPQNLAVSNCPASQDLCCSLFRHPFWQSRVPLGHLGTLYGFYGFYIGRSHQSKCMTARLRLEKVEVKGLMLVKKVCTR